MRDHISILGEFFVGRFKICGLLSEISVGKGVIFHLRLVRGWTENNFLSLPGTVARCTPIGGAHEIGGHFDADLEEHANRLLDTLIRMLTAQFDVGGDAGPAR